jgi:hypothetical protein
VFYLIICYPIGTPQYSGKAKGCEQTYVLIEALDRDLQLFLESSFSFGCILKVKMRLVTQMPFNVIDNAAAAFRIKVK